MGVSVRFFRDKEVSCTWRVFVLEPSVCGVARFEECEVFEPLSFHSHASCLALVFRVGPLRTLLD